MNIVQSTSQIWRDAELRKPKLEKHHSPPGALGLPPLLEERRLKYGIVDEYFKIQAAFKRVYVRQIPDWDGPTFGPESQIIRTENEQERNRQSTPRGVIVSAGLEALDILRSNGMDVGDIVWVVQLAIFRLPVLVIDGKPEVALVLQVGDVVGAEDTMQRVNAEKLVLNYDEAALQHYYERRGDDGEKLFSPRPISPWTPDEF